MNYFNMSYDEILDSPWQRLIFLANSIPSHESKKAKKEEDKNAKSGILDFVRSNNLVK